MLSLAFYNIVQKIYINFLISPTILKLEKKKLLGQREKKKAVTRLAKSKSKNFTLIEFLKALLSFMYSIWCLTLFWLKLILIKRKLLFNIYKN